MPFALDPNLAEAYNQRGVVRQARGDLDGAIADYSRSIDIDPRNAHTYCNRANARQAKGDLTGAMADYDQSLILDPGLAVAYSGRCLVRKSLGDIRGAIADCNRAIEISPGLAEAYNNRGLARSDLGDLEGAIADYDRALAINPRLAVAYGNRGLDAPSSRRRCGRGAGFCALSCVEPGVEAYDRGGRKENQKIARFCMWSDRPLRVVGKLDDGQHSSGRVREHRKPSNVGNVGCDTSWRRCRTAAFRKDRSHIR